jgi:hypothetical protein
MDKRHLKEELTTLENNMKETTDFKNAIHERITERWQ